eukprot:g5295.t1
MDLRCFAKKKSKKRKQESQIAPPVKTAEPWAEVDAVMWLLLVIESYKRQTGKVLLEDVEISSITKEIFEAPFCLLIHDYFEVEKPSLVYANKSALNMMEGDWNDIIGAPSVFFEKSILDQAATEGCLNGLNPKVQSIKGTIMELQEAELVNITSPSDEKMGQMIIFSKWVMEDGTVAGPGQVMEAQVPSEEEIAQLKSLVDEIASGVRNLKENQGYTNNDEIVQNEVAKLLDAKKKLEELDELRNQWLQQNENMSTQE